MFHGMALSEGQVNAVQTGRIKKPQTKGIGHFMDSWGGEGWEWKGTESKQRKMLQSRPPSNEVSERRHLGWECRYAYECGWPREGCVGGWALNCTSLRKTAMPCLCTQCGEGSLSPMRPATQCLVIAWDQAWKSTHRILNQSQTPQCRG